MSDLEQTLAESEPAGAENAVATEAAGPDALDLQPLVRRLARSEDLHAGIAAEAEQLRLRLGLANVAAARDRQRREAAEADATLRAQAYQAAIEELRDEAEALRARIGRIEAAREEDRRRREGDWDRRVRRDRKLLAMRLELDQAQATLADQADRLDRQARLVERCEIRLRELAPSPLHRRLGDVLGRRSGPDRELRANARRLAASGLFDPAWYLSHCALAAASALTPAEHYLCEGAEQGVAPNPLFDAGWYVAMNGLSHLPPAFALLHYIDIGAEAGLSPHWLVDPATLAKAGKPLAEHLRQGADAGSPHPAFDPARYRQARPDLAPDADPLVHFLTHGRAGCDAPNRELSDGGLQRLARTALFDAAAYREQFPAAAFAQLSPVEHYVFWGARHGAEPHPLFDSRCYLAQRPELAASGANPLLDFLDSGWTRGLSPHPAFDPAWYLERNPDVAAAGDNPLEHFVRDGWIEGRSPHPSITGLFDADTPGLHQDLARFLSRQAARIGVAP